jgi:cytochrome c7-like protein
MPQIFHRSTNTFSRVSVFGALFGIASVLGLAWLFFRSPYITGVGVPVVQPVAFSHKHHVGDDGIDCRYCHTSVENSAFAGLPPTQTCMNCHGQLFADSPALAVVRQSWESGVPIAWNRVHALPDFVYFDHSIHVQKGVGCVTCHGQVDQMPLTAKAETMQMSWCLTCHRDPASYVRPREQVFNLHWQPTESQAVLGARLVKEYNIQTLTECSTCHR